MNIYYELKQRQQKAFNDFTDGNVFYAFSQKQFEEGMKSIGLKPSDTSEVYRGCGGMYYKKTFSKPLANFLSKSTEELEKEIENDKTGDGFIYDMFLYELANHEYSYTGDVNETLDYLGYTRNDIENNRALKHGLVRACANLLYSENEEGVY